MEIDGVLRTTDVGSGQCIKDTNLYLKCGASHTRGYLEESEEAGGMALCSTLTVRSLP